MDNLQTLSQLIRDGDLKQIPDCMQTLLSQGTDIDRILSQSITPALDDVGKRFETQQIFIPEMLLSARAAKLAIELTKSTQNPIIRYRKKMILGTVAGDLHDIGRNLVAMSVMARGIEVVDLGVDVSPEQFVAAAENDERVALVGISALLSTTLPAMKKTVAALRQSPAHARFRILVGGAPVTPAFAKQIKADIYTQSAHECAQTAAKILEVMDSV